MERGDQIREKGIELLEERLYQNLKDIAAAISSEGRQMINDLLFQWETLLVRAAELQDAGEKGPANYCCISFLRSGLLTGRHCLHFDIYDTGFYKDLTEVSADWEPCFVFKYFAQDMAYFQDKIQIYPRLKDYEVMEFAGSYIFHYYRILQKIIEDHIDILIQHPAFEVFKHTDDFQISFGGYMEKAVVIYPNDRRER